MLFIIGGACVLIAGLGFLNTSQTKWPFVVAGVGVLIAAADILTSL